MPTRTYQTPESLGAAASLKTLNEIADAPISQWLNILNKEPGLVEKNKELSRENERLKLENEHLKRTLYSPLCSQPQFIPVLGQPPILFSGILDLQHFIPIYNRFKPAHTVGVSPVAPFVPYLLRTEQAPGLPIANSWFFSAALSDPGALPVPGTYSSRQHPLIFHPGAL
jgi:hypothetical protein